MHIQWIYNISLRSGSNALFLSIKILMVLSARILAGTYEYLRVYFNLLSVFLSYNQIEQQKEGGPDYKE